MSALLMAIFLRGMTPAEIARWTRGDGRVGSGSTSPIFAGPVNRSHWSTNTPPEASATRSPSRSFPSCSRAAVRCRQAAGRGLSHRRNTRQARSDPGFTAELSKSASGNNSDVGAAIFADR